MKTDGSRLGLALPSAGARCAPDVPPLEPRAGADVAPGTPHAIAETPPKRLRMLDLFSGSGSASRAAAVRGWDVVRIDNAIGTCATSHDDIHRLAEEIRNGEQPKFSAWLNLGERYDLVWASPPCTLLSTVNQKNRDVETGLELVRDALYLIEVLEPRWWVLENVHGATRAIGDLIGPPVARYGSFYLWGVFPPFVANVPRNKMKLKGRRRAERRAAIPWEISDGLVRACEALARELSG